MAQGHQTGEESIHGEARDGIKFARAVAGALQYGTTIEPAVTQDAMQMLSTVKIASRFCWLNSYMRDLLQVRLAALDGRLGSRSRRSTTLNECWPEENIHNIDMDIERAYIRLAMGKSDEAQALIDLLLQFYAYDQEALEKLDKLLSEPVSESNRSLVAQINRDGIELYNQAQYDMALDAFAKAQVMFLKHLGIQLNILQCLVGKLRLEPLAEEQSSMLHNLLAQLTQVVTRSISSLSVSRAYSRWR